MLLHNHSKTTVAVAAAAVAVAVSTEDEGAAAAVEDIAKGGIAHPKRNTCTSTHSNSRRNPIRPPKIYPTNRPPTKSPTTSTIAGRTGATSLTITLATRVANPDRGTCTQRHEPT